MTYRDKGRLIAEVVAFILTILAVTAVIVIGVIVSN